MDTLLHEQSQSAAASPVTADELQALIDRRAASAASMLASHTEMLERLNTEARELIELAIKAVELGEMLGGDDEDARPDQLLLRDIRDGLVRRARATP